MLNFLTEIAYFFSVIIRVFYPIYAISSLPYGDNLTFQPVWLVVVLFISIVASILPARGATQVSVRESLAYA